MNKIDKHKFMKAKLFRGALFCMMLIWNVCGINANAEKKQEPLAVIYSASDFQNPRGHEEGAVELKKITEQIYSAGYTRITEALICGDYNASDDKSEKITMMGMETIKNVLNNQWEIGYDQILFVQGNHDPSDIENMDKTGAYDREYYSVYQINYRDFGMQMKDYINEEEHLIDASKDLKEWLDEKITERYSKPIFVITHLPLHNSYRYDNLYSEHLFEVLNESAAKGLNIVYLFGHNHAKEYDCYLGGDAICLTKGDLIIIPDVQGNGPNDYKIEKLNFTYVNAGYLSRPEEDMLSSCVFEIYENHIKVKRYNANGVCNLKNSGVSSVNDCGWNSYENIVESPHIIELNDRVISILSRGNIIDELQLDIDQETVLKIAGLDETKHITWENSNSDVVDVNIDKKDPVKITVKGKKYGTSIIRGRVDRLEVSIPIFVMPDNAVKIKYGKNNRIYTLTEDIVNELKTQELLSDEYMILNRNSQGNAYAFSVQDNECVAAEEMTIIYVPSVGEVVTPKEMKHVLWHFERTEDLSKTESYYLKVSEKSPYRYGYYLSSTKDIDSSLDGMNANKMRLHSSEAIAGASIFEFLDLNEIQCVTKQHKDNNGNIKLNEYGEFILSYDAANQAFVLDNVSSGDSAYFYRRCKKVISDVIFWTNAEKGACYIGSNGTRSTGGNITIMHEDSIEELPITLEMLSGYEEGTVGRYLCKVTFNGEVISETYELTIEKAPNVIIQWIFDMKEWVRNIFEKNVI